MNRRNTYQKPRRHYRPAASLTLAAYLIASSGIAAATYALGVAAARLT